MDTAEDFTTLVENLVHVILAHHKHSRLPATSNDPIPRFLMETEAYLIRKIKPFLPSEETNLCAHYNAKIWTSATIETLKEHYGQIKDKAVDTIRTLLVPDWNRAFLVASRRAKKQSKNINPTSLESTYTLLRDIMSPSFPLPDIPKTPPRNGKRTGTQEQQKGHQDPNQPLIQGTPQTLLDCGKPFTQKNMDWEEPQKNSTFKIEIEKPSSQKPNTTEEQPQQPTTPTMGLLSENNPCVCIRPLSPIIEITNGETLKTSTANSTEPLTTDKRKEQTEQLEMIKRRKGDATEEDPIQMKTPSYCTLSDPPQRKTPTRQIPLATYHAHRGNKFENWTLEPTRPIVIMGDSNISRLPHISDNRIQTDCYPGAKIVHAEYIIRHKTRRDPSVTIMILSFGINDRETSNPSLLKKPLGSLFHITKFKFPNAVIYMPLINYSNNLSPQIQQNISQLNELIKSYYSIIPRLNMDTFKTLPDNIHWTPDTARNMWKHWKDFLE